MTVLIAGLGFWLGANRLLPLWLISAIAVFGLACWATVEWMERAERRQDDES
ncbi:hypothetical protein NAV33_17745 [Pseudomonas stutzeri]|uniref:hypothetical protein n=1 Tax=Stutzerimonas stutzeri TaxID=316 RepID=UPI00210AAED8|nr:hypothetical protein [Stutzerimonas stutzeri]MCQ4313716.1 hypothetical protein [Stutzerimonas stutzeri]